MSMQPVDKTPHQTLADAGQKRIAWAQQLMPIVTGAANTLCASGILTGQHIGLCLPIDAKTANLALVLVDAGAKVSCWAPGHYTDAGVTHALRQKGVAVFSATNEIIDSPVLNNPLFEDDGSAARALLMTSPDILLDNGAEIISLAYAEFPDVFARLKGATESCKTGIDKLHDLQKKQDFNTPVINLNDTPLYQIFNNNIGTGQSVVMAMLDLTNLQIAGRRVLVVGYGSVGKGIASHAAALGALVTVAEIDPFNAMQAQYDGYLANSIADSAARAEVVFTATGRAATLTADHIDVMPDGVIICAAGRGQSELPLEYLERATDKKSVRTHVTEYQFSNGNNLLLIADGHCVNTVAGEGCPIEIADKLMALQLASIEFLLSDKPKRKTDIQFMLQSCEQKIALAHLKLTGGTIEH